MSTNNISFYENLTKYFSITGLPHYNTIFGVHRNRPWRVISETVL